MGPEDLNDDIRHLMLEEIELDLAAGSIHQSTRLRPGTFPIYRTLLQDAARCGTFDDLATRIAEAGLLSDREPYTRGGVTRTKRVPADAARTLAQGEFNRYYMRAACQRALDLGRQVQVTRSVEVAVPRPQAAALLGRVLAPGRLLGQLRSAELAGDEQILLQANNGLSLQLT